MQRELNQRFPQVQVVIRAFGQGPPSEAPVAFHISGSNLAELKRLDDELQRIMQTVPAIVPVPVTMMIATVVLSFRSLVLAGLN